MPGPSTPEGSAEPGGTGDSPEDLLRLALSLARSAAEVLVAGAQAGPEVWASTTKSSDTDHVTEVDRDAERLIVEGVRRARPHDGILGEEGADHAGTSGYRWVIDPLDGTTNFVYGLPAYAVSIAVERGGLTIAGVVADAARSEVFSAVLGSGAWLEVTGTPAARRRRLRCRDDSELATALVGTGFSYDGGARARQGAVAAGLLPQVRDLRRVGAAAIDLCWVACGRLDAFYERGLQPWDIGAGALIAREAGAEVTDVDGHPVVGGWASGRLAVAAGPALATTLRTALRALRADEG